MTSHDLLRKWSRERDELAFRELVHRHAPMVFATSRRILRDDTEAEDVTQECFETLATTRRLPTSNLGPWLHRVATNRCLDRLRTTGRRAKREIDFAARQFQPHATDWNDIYNFVDEAIAELPDKYRAVIVPHFLEGRTQADIANELNLTRQAVHERLSRGIESIRTYLKRRGIELSATALTALLAQHASATAIPLALTASLGKLALGAHAAAAPGILAALSTGIPAWILGTSVVILTVIGGLMFRVNEHATTASEATDLPNPTIVTAASTVEAVNSTPLPGPPSASTPGSQWPLGSSTATEPTVTRPQPEVVDEGTRNASMSGVIVRADGKAFANARIVLDEITGKSQPPALGKELISTFANENGHFAFKNLKPGDYSVQVTGSDVWVGGVGFEIAQIHLDAEQSRTDLRLVYGTEGKRKIAGTVVTRQDVPIPKVNVMISGAVIRATVTDAKGHFLLEFLPDGEYRLTAETEFTPHPQYGRAYATARAGSENLKVVLPRTGRISGRVVQKDSLVPVTNFRVDNTTFSDPNGAFLLEGVQPGRDHITVTALDRSSVSVEVEVPEGDTLSNVVVALPSARILNGMVTDADGRPIASARIYQDGPKSNNTRSNDIPIAVTDGSGAYTTDELPIMVKGLSANHPGYAPGFAPASGSPTIVLHKPARLVAMVTENGKPYTKAGVRVFIVGGARNMFSEYARVDTSGQAVLENLPPGMAVVSTSHSSDYYGRSVVQRVRIDPETETKLSFEFASVTSGLEGLVVWEGSPAASTRVFLQVSTNNGLELYQTSTKEDGRFSFTDLPDGSASIKVSSPKSDYMVIHETTLLPDHTTTETIAFPGSNKIEGRFIGFNGSELGTVVLLAGRHAPETFIETINFGGTAPFEYIDSNACDERGFYVLDNLDPGEYTVVAQSGALDDWGSLQVFASTYVTVIDGVVARADFEYK